MDSEGSRQACARTPTEGQPLPMIGQLKLSSAQAAGPFEVIEYTAPAIPPPHIHHGRDECFCILEGVFTFALGSEQVQAAAGSIVFIPRGARHAFEPAPGARALLFVFPAGLGGFFRELGEGLLAGHSSAELRAALAGKYDPEPVG